VIASVSGQVLASSSGVVIVEIGGVGVTVNTTTRICSSLSNGTQVKLATVLVVREDSLTLYGFTDTLELETFDLLRSVNGVGPKSALSILNSLTVQEIFDAVHSESDRVFKSVSGVGPKTAKLITLTLAGKLPHGLASGSFGKSRAKSVDALISLGYSERASAQAVSQVYSEELSDEQVFKLALRQLGGTN
jgi:Holliday junction DNA helicase RuvA